MKDETTYFCRQCAFLCIGPSLYGKVLDLWCAKHKCDFTVWHYHYNISDQDNYSPHQFSWLLDSIVLVVLRLRNRTASGLYRLKYILRSRILSNVTCVCCSHCAFSGDILLYAVIMSRTCAECVSNFTLSWCLRFKMSRRTIVTTVLYTT